MLSGHPFVALGTAAGLSVSFAAVGFRAGTPLRSQKYLLLEGGATPCDHPPCSDAPVMKRLSVAQA